MVAKTDDPAPGDRPDHVERIVAQWAREAPDIDVESLLIFGRMRRIARRLGREIDALLARHGLDAGQYYVLTALRRAGPPFTLRPTEIYRTLMISSGGLTNRLDRLEKAGLVRRRRAQDDARERLVALTPAGRRKVEAVFRENMAVERGYLAGLAPAERAMLARLLKRLAAAFDGTGEDDAPPTRALTKH